VLIRPATTEDLPTLLDLVHAAYRGEGGWTTEADLIDGTRTDTDELRELLPDLLVVEQDGALLGCCSLVPRGDRASFGLFAVRPAQQGAGVGSALLAAAEERARQLGLSAIEMSVVSVRSELLAYYERRGYAATGETRPFPYGVERNGRPRRDDLIFTVLVKPLAQPR
jgi:N-acetylglutamate synthase-like GNAT family acetyltransferase